MYFFQTKSFPNRSKLSPPKTLLWDDVWVSSSTTRTARTARTQERSDPESRLTHWAANTPRLRKNLETKSLLMKMMKKKQPTNNQLTTTTTLTMLTSPTLWGGIEVRGRLIQTLTCNIRWDIFHRRGFDWKW